MSTVLLLASCEHLNQALDIRADIIWHAKIWHVFCHSTTSAFVSSGTKTAHSTQPSIQIQSKNQSEATTKKRLTDTPYLLAGIILKKSSSKHKVSLLF